jgi:hypothetical protein
MVLTLFLLATAGYASTDLSGLPIFVVAQEMAWVPEIHGGKQEEPDHTQVSHFLKSPVRGVNASANDAELASRHLLA